MGLELLVMFSVGTALAWLANRSGSGSGLGGIEPQPTPGASEGSPGPTQPAPPAAAAPAPAPAVPSAFPGGPQGLEESVAWIAQVADPKAKPDAIRAKLRKLIQDGLVVVAIPSETSYFSFWNKLKGGAGATPLSDDEARALLDAGPAFSSQAFLLKGGKLYRLAAPIVSSSSK